MLAYSASHLNTNIHNFNIGQFNSRVNLNTINAGHFKYEHYQYQQIKTVPVGGNQANLLMVHNHPRHSCRPYSMAPTDIDGNFGHFSKKAYVRTLCGNQLG